jgi:glucose-6-phosphate isomerase
MLPETDYPISIVLEAASGLIQPCPNLVERHVSDLKAMFYDQTAAECLIAAGDPLVYEIRYYPFVTSKSDMAIAVTRILPGSVGDEFFMSKGHQHARDDQAEIYYCLTGEGYLLLDTLEGEFRAEPWSPGTVTHIPPMWAHRAVNTGREALVYAGFYHLSAGHVYDRVEQQGFAQVAVRRSGLPVLMDRQQALQG